MGDGLKCALLIVCFWYTLGVRVTPGWTRQESPSKPLSVGAQAVGVVSRHYAFDPEALNPKTAQSLPSNGKWSLSKVPPASCPQTEERCVEIFYEVPEEAVRCSWVVLLNADGTDGKFLDENDDTDRYMRLKVTKDEAAALVDTRKKPAYPPIAVASGVAGAVILDVLVGKTGEVQKARIVSGHPMLQGASIDAARSWKFKPMMVGARTVPYEIQLVFTFQKVNPTFTRVDVAP
jgi:TonB family protein